MPESKGIQFFFFKSFAKHCVCAQSCPTLCNRQDPLSMGFSRQEYWSGLSFPPPGDLPNPGIELSTPARRLLLWPVNSLSLSHLGSIIKVLLENLYQLPLSLYLPPLPCCLYAARSSFINSDSKMKTHKSNP